MPRGIPRIKDKSHIPCNYCKAQTSRYKPCKRLASCKKGCKNFCTFHADSLGGRVTKRGSRVIKCKEPEIQDCLLDNKEFPCKKKFTYFWSKKSYNQYLKSKEERRIKNKRSNRSIIRSYKKRHQNSPKYKTRSRRIKFSL